MSAGLGLAGSPAGEDLEAWVDSRFARDQQCAFGLMKTRLILGKSIVKESDYFPLFVTCELTSGVLCPVLASQNTALFDNWRESSD